MKVLVINPGATSTKVAVFEEERELLKKSIVHTAQELEGFDRVIDQADFRQRAVLEAVAEGGFRLEDFDAVCGRGGLYRPIPSGTYAVRPSMAIPPRSAPRSLRSCICLRSPMPVRSRRRATPSSSSVCWRMAT